MHTDQQGHSICVGFIDLPFQSSYFQIHQEGDSCWVG
jgi:hypothetical protein